VMRRARGHALAQLQGRLEEMYETHWHAVGFH